MRVQKFRTAGFGILSSFGLWGADLATVVEVKRDDQPEGHSRVGDFEVVDYLPLHVTRQTSQDPHLLRVCYRKKSHGIVNLIRPAN